MKRANVMEPHKFTSPRMISLSPLMGGSNIACSGQANQLRKSLAESHNLFLWQKLMPSSI
jgi:hypothetical protein